MHYPLVAIISRKDGTGYEAAEAAVEHLIKPYNTVMEVEPHEDDCWECEGLETPDPECEECHGMGRFITTIAANPVGRWDYLQIGRRFTGALVTDYDPESDPANKMVCPSCTGPRKQYERENCTTCGSTGIAVEWPTDWRPFDRDVLPVPSVRTDYIPFAVVTPDGKWQDESDFDRNVAAWERVYRAVMAAHPDGLAVIVDCHIDI